MPPLSKEERDVKRVSLFARMVNYEADFRCRLAVIRAILEKDPLENELIRLNYNEGSIGSFIVEAEDFSEAMDRRQNNLFTDMVEFLQAAREGLPTAGSQP